MTSTLFSFGEWLTRQRKLRDLTRDEIARRAACSVSTLRRLEADDLRPSLALAESLARALEFPTEQRAAFIAFARGESKTPPDVQAIPNDQKTIKSLPAPLTPFIGRTRQVNAIADLIRQPTVRLITLTGPPGTGKTRLSLAVANKVNPAFRDGIHFIALDSIRDPNLVIATIAQNLGLNEKQNDLAHTLADFLRERSLLLLLDNFEHLLSAAPHISDLLIAAPNVQAIATSRELLHIYGEHEFPVPPLELIDVNHLPTTHAPGLYAKYSSIKLFETRARAVDPNFRLTRENVADVARICAWLDGLPLAIEIAAAQIKWNAPHQLLAELRDRLGALTGGPRDLTPRQQSLRGAIDWSYQMLDPDEQRLFNGLGIFWEGCTEDAIQHSVGAISNFKLHLRNLVEKNLVRHAIDREGQARYTQLEIMREYARDQLTMRGELESARQKHAEYFIAFAQETNIHWKAGQDQTLWLNRLKHEINNLRAAMAWALESPARIYMAQDLAVAINNFWHTWGWLTEARRWLDQIIALDATPTQRYANVLNCIGNFARSQGDYARARQAHEQALTILQTYQDQTGILLTTESLAILAGIQADYARAAELLGQVATMRRQMNDVANLSITLNNLALATRRLGNLERAKQLYEETIAMARKNGTDKSLAHACVGLGEVLMDLKDYDAAVDLFRASIPIRNQQGDTRGLAITFISLAMALHALGKSVHAVPLASVSEKILQEIGYALPPKDHDEFQILKNGMRSALGDADFDRAWARGQTLSIDQAIAWAMEKNG